MLEDMDMMTRLKSARIAALDFCMLELYLAPRCTFF
jgi:hypothetical protein